MTRENHGSFSLVALRELAAWFKADGWTANAGLVAWSADRIEELEDQLKDVEKAINAALDSERRAADRIEELEKTIDTLESNARVQAKLLANTGRRAEELEAALREGRPFIADSGCDEDDMEVNLRRIELLAKIDAALAAKEGK